MIGEAHAGLGVVVEHEGVWKRPDSLQASVDAKWLGTF